MRGTVTLAAALALPTGNENVVPFPYRDLIIVSAFGVVLGTLVLQGLTLRPLLLWLKLVDDGSVEREVKLARAEGLRAAVTATSVHAGGGRAADLVHDRFALQLSRAEVDLRNDVSVSAAGAGDAAAVRAAFDAMRKRLTELRRDATIGDAAFQRLQEELDWSEQGWAQVIGRD
jgi:CPA1 family monovalent cation:H+ antiporter